MNRKKWKKLLILFLCLLFVQAPALHLVQPVRAAAASKSGLTEKKGNYYFYNAKGVKIKNKWKKIKGSYYYFGSNGAAVKGKTEMEMDGMEITVPAVKTIAGKKYAFDSEGKRMSGVVVKNNKLFMFDSGSGVYDAAATQKLRKAAGYGQPAETLKALLTSWVGKPLKEEVIEDRCDGSGQDIFWYYKNFTVSVFRPIRGNELVMGIMAA